ncbi:MAG: 2-oxoacid:ferredoxin oxidoreductase subunit beta [Planctomycetes bacterium]|nr:2-oxoacid:ferredoxin oxidoreductase subunit beta [Planctomycetota bacterium]
MSTTQETAAPAYTRNDFKSSQEVRWCPGCGDYAILNNVQSVLAELGISREKFVMVSGIGCSSRFPYYMESYGFHTIHGRAPAVATGIKLANPELSVWVATGDGDSLAIGGNHLIHALRRNIDINILLFNNEIYGLTKGQYSPTSHVGQVTKSTPFGSVDHPFNPISLALGAGATFIARSADVFNKHLCQILERAARHKGTSFIEILQNCPIFNDGAWDEVTKKTERANRVVELVHGKPVIWGDTQRRGIRLEGTHLEVVDVASEDGSAEGVLVWDETDPHCVLPQLMAHVKDPRIPVPIGVFRSVEIDTFDEEMHRQVQSVKEKKGEGSLEDLIHSGVTWEVK